MKGLRILFFVFGFYSVANAQLQYENFDASTIPAGWSATTTATGCSWQFGFTGSLPGSGFFTPASFPSGGVVFDDGACGHSNANYITLTTPEIDLVSQEITSAAIEVTYNHQTFSAAGDFLITAWDGTDWVTIHVEDDDMPSPNTGLNHTEVIDISEYINNQFKVRFIWDDQNSNASWGLGIDDYKLVNTATVHINNIEDLGFSYYPNPILHNELTINATEAISSINVFNALGEQLLSKHPETIQSKIHFKNAPTGIYIIKVAIGNKSSVFKVLKK